MELADVTDSKSVGLITRAGSTPATGTMQKARVSELFAMISVPPIPQNLLRSFRGPLGVPERMIYASRMKERVFLFGSCFLARVTL